MQKNSKSRHISNEEWAAMAEKHGRFIFGAQEFSRNHRSHKKPISLGSLRMARSKKEDAATGD